MKSVRRCTVNCSPERGNDNSQGAKKRAINFRISSTRRKKARSTVITKHGRPVAALVPIEASETAVRQEPLTPLAGSGRGLWGKGSARTIRKLRGEWSR